MEIQNTFIYCFAKYIRPDLFKQRPFRNEQDMKPQSSRLKKVLKKKKKNFKKTYTEQ